eukprot:6180252-Amphidinium_carterae.1
MHKRGRRSKVKMGFLDRSWASWFARCIKGGSAGSAPPFCLLGALPCRLAWRLVLACRAV